MDLIVSGRRARLVVLLAAGAALVVLGVVLSGGGAATDRFPDIPLDHPFAAAILDLSGGAIVEGYDDGVEDLVVGRVTPETTGGTLTP